MNLEEALKCLGSTRVIWIDDHFNDTPALLGNMLADNIEITQKCSFPELGDIPATFHYDELTARARIIEIIAALSEERQAEMRGTYFKQEDRAEPADERELSGDEVAKACELLGVATDDRWPFDGYEKKIAELCKQGDANVSYIIDLKDSRGDADDKSGLEVIKLLHTFSSKGTAFILTHEASITNEAEKEAQFRNLLAEEHSDMPLCVVSKERLATQEGEPHDVEEALRIAIKRAGLKRSVHEVLNHARHTVSRSFEEAMQLLLQVPPELLDKYAVERAYKEGVSEMHVIERALTAHISQQIRVLFGTNQEVLQSTQRLRNLRGIPLRDIPGFDHKHLTTFRDAEVWESEVLINSGFAQLACGDVFEFDRNEQKARGASAKRFVLLAQPCDITLRPNGKRDIQTAVLAPLKKKPEGKKKDDNEKEYTLPFVLDGEKWVCDLRDATPVKLNILDLASFRPDGIVAFINGQAKPPGLTPGHDKIYEDRTHLWSRIVDLCEADSRPERPLENYRSELQLTFASPDTFKLIENGGYEASSGKADARRDGRLTWYLKRCGRIRMPFASAILDRYVGVVNRQAFDVDFMDIPAPEDAAVPAAAAATA